MLANPDDTFTMYGCLARADMYEHDAAWCIYLAPLLPVNLRADKADEGAFYQRGAIEQLANAIAFASR